MLPRSCFTSFLPMWHGSVVLQGAWSTTGEILGDTEPRSSWKRPFRETACSSLSQGSLFLVGQPYFYSDNFETNKCRHTQIRYGWLIFDARYASDALRYEVFTGYNFLTRATHRTHYDTQCLRVTILWHARCYRLEYRASRISHP